MKILQLLLLVSLVTGCLSNPVKKAPEGEYKWSNKKLYDSAEKGLTSWKEVDHQFVVDTNTCKIEALKIPIPSPSCTQAYRRDCSGLQGFAAGICQSQSNKPRCDYSSVNAAYDAQKEIKESCLILRGWEKKWIHFDSLVGLESPTDRFPQYKVDALVKKNKDLYHWKTNLPEVWYIAKWLDEKVRRDVWHSLSFEERLPLLVIQTRQMLSDLVLDSEGDMYRKRFAMLLESYPDFYNRALGEDGSSSDFGKVFAEISNDENELTSPIEHVEYVLKKTLEIVDK